MVDAVLFDKLDEIAKAVRTTKGQRARPFGGLQVSIAWGPIAPGAALTQMMAACRDWRLFPAATGHQRHLVILCL